MTSFAFILGVAPLAVGMIGVTIFGLLFTPVFYTIVRKLGRRTS
jgi:multidrug efflux pump subunit AcrB